MIENDSKLNYCSSVLFYNSTTYKDKWHVSHHVHTHQEEELSVNTNNLDVSAGCLMQGKIPAQDSGLSSQVCVYKYMSTDSLHNCGLWPCARSSIANLTDFHTFNGRGRNTPWNQLVCYLAGRTSCRPFGLRYPHSGETASLHRHE